ncbi:PLD nuclease N-terminal domain-containing protein [Kitasatospora atroaurantiaca]|uniref:Phospholipase D-like protein n=1 Tax=Kitasatospora atroaurantiaca TaxID=285545 RepID=A0A561EQR6_9ACTN|nr:PLD nuclease N-terminal domain-containing protein [Kitasatospora atroaurantiaca]TWE17957.1 phospholipase D-like protein [Kitasatospora atroaurantiaca]
MLRILPPLLALALWIWAFIDCLTTPEDEVRHLPKVVWVIIVLFFPLLGSIAWLVAGKQRGGLLPARAAATERPGGRSVAPDDDPEFLASLKKDNGRHEDMLKQWEADLRRREDELRDKDDPESGPKR